MNNRLLIVLFFVIVSCSSAKKVSDSDIQSPIIERYGTDLISSEELAAKIAEIIWTERYVNDKIQLYKPFEVKLIENGKVWEITGNSPLKGNVIKRTYHMKINKNTGEILRNWVEK